MAQGEKLDVLSDFWEQIRPKTALGIALWFSVAVHLIILSIHFEPELKKFANSVPTLEVMLTNTKTKEAPTKADVLAQANLDRGGNTDQNRKMKTALPAPKHQVQEVALQQAAASSAAKAAKLKDKAKKQQKNVAELEKQAQELMTKLESLKQVQSTPQQKATSANPEKGKEKANVKSKLDVNDLIATAKEMDRLEALIAKQQDEYQKRPKRKFIGARAKEYAWAMYLDAWRHKVERIGNLNYPEAAKVKKLYGKLQMTVSIKSDGTIEKIKINRSSGHKVLDDAAKRIVQLSAPFSAFPKKLKKQTDIVSVTRTWTFTRENSLTGEE